MLDPDDTHLHATAAPGPGCVFLVAVTFTWHRPVRPDERTHYVTIAMDDDDPVNACLLVGQWLASRAGVVMPTRTTIQAAIL